MSSVIGPEDDPLCFSIQDIAVNSSSESSFCVAIFTMTDEEVAKATIFMTSKTLH